MSALQRKKEDGQDERTGVEAAGWSGAGGTGVAEQRGGGGAAGDLGAADAAGGGAGGWKRGGRGGGPARRGGRPGVGGGGGRRARVFGFVWPTKRGSAISALNSRV